MGLCLITCTRWQDAVNIFWPFYDVTVAGSLLAQQLIGMLSEFEPDPSSALTTLCDAGDSNAFPVWCIQGLRDPLLPVLASHVDARARTAVVEPAKHDVPFSHPQQVGDLIYRIIRENVRLGGVSAAPAPLAKGTDLTFVFDKDR